MKTADQIIEMQKRNLSQWEISRETGVSQATISRIAAGKQKDPRSSIVDAVDGLYKRVIRRKVKNAII